MAKKIHLGKDEKIFVATIVASINFSVETGDSF